MLKGKCKYGVIMTAILALILAACGGTITKQEDVLKELDKISQEISSYHLHAELMVDHEGMAQTYYVEVWYQRPELYKVALKNDSREVSQIIIKNEDGVHVVNPYMNKVFKFSKDWPHASGQLYLYQTLLNNILQAETLEYEYKDDLYVFAYDVQNGQHVAKQEVVLGEGFYPKSASMTDGGQTVKINVTFENFEANVDIADTEFVVDEQLKSNINSGGEATAASAVMKQEFAPMQPEYVPFGMGLQSVSVLQEKGENYAVLQYAGENGNFTLIEKPDTTETGTVAKLDGELLEIYGNVVLLSGGATPTLQWYANGMEFTLSGNIPIQEMEKIAASVYSPIK